MIEEHGLDTFRDIVAEAFKAGMELFPDFTLHGREHLEELDRLVLLMAQAIPELKRDPNAVSLLRLAVILHDYAMVAVPTTDREAELREQMGPEVSFAEIVRKTHQDEIVHALSNSDTTAVLTSTFPNAGLGHLKDACEIAKFHRFHPLKKAPEHLRGLCALMRLVDELEIGPRRAPRPAYLAKRARMGPESRLHWLKHICSREIDKRLGTMTFEERGGNRRIVKVWVAVAATADSWRGLQDLVYQKIRRCLLDEGVSQIVKDRWHVEVQVRKGPDDLCGELPILPKAIEEDLAELAASPLCADPGDSQTDVDVPPPVLHEAINVPQTGVGTPASNVERLSPSVPVREFRIVAIPPESLPEFLSSAGRLSVINNKYVAPGEERVGGPAGAPSRLYVGPADCGKTRAAAEWVGITTRQRPGAWVVLRTDMGVIPENTDNIVLDTSRYAPKGLQVPQRAILFL